MMSDRNITDISAKFVHELTTGYPCSHWIFGDQGFIMDLHILGLLGITVSQFCCLLLNTTNYMILLLISFSILPATPPTTGQGWMEQRLPVWREECRSFKKPFVFFCFGYFPGYFRHFFDNTGTQRRISDLWMCRWGKFVIFTCNAVEFTSYFKTLYTIARHSNANVDLKYFCLL